MSMTVKLEEKQSKAKTKVIIKEKKIASLSTFPGL